MTPCARQGCQTKSHPKKVFSPEICSDWTESITGEVLRTGPEGVVSLRLWFQPPVLMHPITPVPKGRRQGKQRRPFRAHAYKSRPPVVVTTGYTTWPPRGLTGSWGQVLKYKFVNLKSDYSRPDPIPHSSGSDRFYRFSTLL